MKINKQNLETKQVQYYVPEMHCQSCKILLENKLSQLPEVIEVKANSKSKAVKLTISQNINNEELLRKANKQLASFNYSLVENQYAHNAKKDYFISFVIAIVVFLIFCFLQRQSLFSLDMENGSKLVNLFFLGILASLSSCMAITGSLIFSLSSAYAFYQQKLLPLLSFHLSRLLSFFLLGGLLGTSANIFSQNKLVFSILNLALMLMMILLALDFLQVIKQRSLFSGFLQSIFHKSEKVAWFTPLLLGMLTFFLPCGFTQTAQFMAINSADFLQAALLMLAFAVGTLPVLLLISFSSFKLPALKSIRFYYFAGFLILFFALNNLYGLLVAQGLIQPLIF